MSELKADMAFDVGDIVYHKSALFTQTITPMPQVVIERHVVECHGGVQKFYKLNEAGAALVPEIALTKEKPAYDDSYSRVREEERARMWDQLRAEKERG